MVIPRNHLEINVDIGVYLMKSLLRLSAIGFKEMPKIGVL